MRRTVILAMGSLVLLFGNTPAAGQAGADPNLQSVEDLQALSQRGGSTMSNPYRQAEGWAQLPADVEWGGAIGLIADDSGGVWMLFRSEPPIVHLDEDGRVTSSFGEGMFVTPHGFCMDQDGNLWAGDSGPFGGDQGTTDRGFQVHKFSQDGEHLLSLGEAGVSREGRDTFIGPSGCAVAPNGDIIIADGHWPRPSFAPQGGDRLVRVTPDGDFVRAVGGFGSGPGEFMGPHDLAFDQEGRLFVADRSNNRVQILDENLEFVDAWMHFGRPSGIEILEDGTLLVTDSESGSGVSGPPQAPEGENGIRNPGWQVGIRIGRASDGSLLHFIPGVRGEGLAGSVAGSIFAGLTYACDMTETGVCLQKWVRRDR